MRYDNPAVLDHLASAYVIGTLSKRVRRRFERLAREPDGRKAQEAIWRWERHLNPMAETIEAVQPRAQVWRDICSRIHSNTEPAMRGLLLWRGLAAAMTLAVMLLLLPYFGPAPEQAAEQLALIENNENQPLWVITVDLDNGLLRSRAINTPAQEADRVFELWMLPADGQPRSFGLLPVSSGLRAQQQISPALVALLQGSKGFAVSIEPQGGSPTGLPTGPVVYTAPIVEL